MDGNGKPIPRAGAGSGALITQSRAPGNGNAPPDREGRVQMCMKLMRAGRWRRGTTDRNVAAHWGLKIDTVQSYSAEAFRRLRTEVTDPDSVQATVCSALEDIIHEARGKGLAGHRSIIEAGKAWAAISGAGAPTRIELGALANMTEDELEARRKEILARLAEAEEEPPK